MHATWPPGRGAPEPPGGTGGWLALGAAPANLAVGEERNVYPAPHHVLNRLLAGDIENLRGGASWQPGCGDRPKIIENRPRAHPPGRSLHRIGGRT